MLNKVQAGDARVGRRSYRGRLAPTPTGFLHLGHAATFGIAGQRARQAGGELLYREEDLDPQRCQAEFAAAALEDLAWLGLTWQGAPLRQSTRREVHLEAWRSLLAAGCIYPCSLSRRQLREALAAGGGDGGEDVRAPQEGAEEPIFPPELRPARGTGQDAKTPAGVNWRFRVPDGEVLRVEDLRLGPREYTAGVDFGDFLVWRRDDVPAYELAVVADDAAQGITEIVRGEDLLLSSARQLLVYRALGIGQPPAFFHTPLLRDAEGRRLAKRHEALALRTLRESGLPAGELRAWIQDLDQALESGSALPLAPFLGGARW